MYVALQVEPKIFCSTHPPFQGRSKGALYPYYSVSRAARQQRRVRGTQFIMCEFILVLIIRTRFFYKPITLTALAACLAVLAYVAMTQDVLEEGGDKRRVYVGP